MAEVILNDETWLVERQPGAVTDPMVVRFRKSSRIRTLLDQNARWTPTGWDVKRWVPQSPIVPAWLLIVVDTHMKEAAYRGRLADWSQQRLADRQQEGEL
jgi:hypothetical protein